jgi:hypothetical protein
MRPNSTAKLVVLVGFGLENTSDQESNPQVGGMKLKLNGWGGEAHSSPPNFTSDLVPLVVCFNDTSELSNVGGSCFASVVACGNLLEIREHLV